MFRQQTRATRTDTLFPYTTSSDLGRIKLDIRLRGEDKEQYYTGKIVGFSSRLNTILVPQSFLKQANANFAAGQEANPSRLIIEVTNPSDPAINEYLNSKGYEKENETTDSGKMAHFLRVIIGIIIGVGLFICLLALYILMLSIFLLLQKNTTKLTNLLLIGYSSRQVAFPYQLITILLNGVILLLSFLLVGCIRPLYLHLFNDVFPGFIPSSTFPIYIIGLGMTAVVTIINLVIIKRKITRLLHLKKKP